MNRSWGSGPRPTWRPAEVPDARLLDERSIDPFRCCSGFFDSEIATGRCCNHFEVLAVGTDDEIDSA